MNEHDCKNNLGGEMVTVKNQYMYKNLGTCNICGKYYINIYGMWEYLSTAEFKSITESREKLFDAFLRNNNDNEDIIISRFL